MLVELLKIGGVAALSVGVMFLLYRQLMQMNIFRRMSQTQTFILMMTLTVLVFVVAIAALSQNGIISLKSVEIDNSVNTNVQQ